jgi:hypothetical protein
MLDVMGITLIGTYDLSPQTRLRDREVEESVSERLLDAKALYFLLFIVSSAT